MTVTDLPVVVDDSLPPSVLLVHGAPGSTVVLNLGEPDPYPWLPAVTYACTCGCPRSCHSGRKHRGRCTCSDCGCVRYSRDPADLHVERAREAADEPLPDAMNREDRRRRRSGKTRRARAAGRWGIGPSDIGECRKRIEYRENPPEDYVPGPEDKTAAIVGTWLDLAYKRLVRREYPWRQVNVRVLVPGFDEPGEIDVYDPLLRRVEDLKSAGEWKWEAVGDRGAFADDVDQAMLYALGLRHERGEDAVASVRITYLRRATGQVETFDVPYDEERAFRAAGYLHGVIDALDLGVPLPRDRQGPSLDGICRRCPAVAHCWQIDAAEAAGRSPEGWLLAREDPQIEAALARYVDAHERLHRPGADVKDEVKVLVEGVDEGTYGDYTLTRSGGKVTYVDDLAARTEQLEDVLRRARAGEAVDDPADLPVPQAPKVSPRRTNIGRVRAAQRKKKPPVAR